VSNALRPSPIIFQKSESNLCALLDQSPLSDWILPGRAAIAVAGSRCDRGAVHEVDAHVPAAVDRQNVALAVAVEVASVATNQPLGRLAKMALLGVGDGRTVRRIDLAVGDKALAKYDRGPYNASEREQTHGMTSKLKAYLALVSAFAGFSILEWLGLLDGWKGWLGIAAGIPLVLWALNAVREYDGFHVHNDRDMGRS
jgi:hypothetical protein